MKKYIIILAALTMGMVSCSKVETENAETNLPATGLTTLTATIPAFTTTKAAVDTDGNFTWKNGDGILVECNATAGGTKEVTFYYNEKTQKFSADLATEGCTSVKENATAKYPAVEPASSQIWSSIGETFKMTGTVNASGVIEFTHQSALVHLVFNNVPSFAKAIKVTNGTEEVTADLNGTSGQIATNIPLTPGVGTSIDINLLDNNGNIIVSKKKTASVVAGTIYSTPEITVRYILVGIRDFIYGNSATGTWNLKENWKVRYWKSGTPDADANLIDLNYTESKSIPGYYSPGVFNMFYTSSVPSDIDGFKVWCDSGGNDWFGENASPDKTKAYLFEWDYGNKKLAYYE